MAKHELTNKLIGGGPRFFLSTVLVLSFLFTECARKPAPATAGTLNKNEIRNLSTDDLSVGILYFVNIYRRSIGIPPIQLNSLESRLAFQHSHDMALGTTPFGHDGFSLRMKTIEKQLGPTQQTAENVAYGKMTAREVVDAWLKSPVHRKNIEGNFLLTGIGCSKNNKGIIFYTEIFTR
jgi:uncharacterized protein YkwD